MISFHVTEIYTVHCSIKIIHDFPFIDVELKPILDNLARRKIAIIHKFVAFVAKVADHSFFPGTAWSHLNRATFLTLLFYRGGGPLPAPIIFCMFYAAVQ